MAHRSDELILRILEQGADPEQIRPDALAQALGSAGVPRLLRALRGVRKQYKICPLCGWTADQFRATNLMGCGLCHTVFQDLVESNGSADPSEQQVLG